MGADVFEARSSPLRGAHILLHGHLSNDTWESALECEGENARRSKLHVANFTRDTPASCGGHQEPHSGHEPGAPGTTEECQYSSTRETRQLSTVFDDTCALEAPNTRNPGIHAPTPPGYRASKAARGATSWHLKCLPIEAIRRHLDTCISLDSATS